MSIKVAAAYIRVSSDDQLEYSPESQLKLIREFAKREGYTIPEEYIFQDDGISGKSAAKRPGFRLMIATAKEGKAPPFSAIFVWKYSRFARNQEEAIMYKNLLRKRGVDVCSISEPSSDSPFSSLIERIIEWMDEYYLINLAGEVRRGMAEKASRGEAMGAPPFGYSVKDKTFVPNEHADTVREIFEQYAAGKGMQTIARDMGLQGIRTPRGNMPDNRWVKYILSNPVYTGKIRWSTEGHANYSRANYNGDNVLLVDGKHQPLIDTALWDRVQHRLNQRQTEAKYKRRNGGNMYMLKGLIRCGDCGSTLTYVSTASPSLQCHKYARGQCEKSHSITIVKANKAIIDYLEQIIESETFVFAPKPPPKSKVRHDWGKLIASEESRLRRAKNALLDGALTSGEYKEIKADIAENIEKLKAGQATEQAQQAPEPDAKIYAKKVKSVLKIIKSPDVSEEAKNQALRSIIEKVLYIKPSNTLQIYFAP